MESPPVQENYRNFKFRWDFLWYKIGVASFAYVAPVLLPTVGNYDFLEQTLIDVNISD